MALAAGSALWAAGAQAAPAGPTYDGRSFGSLPEVRMACLTMRAQQAAAALGPAQLEVRDELRLSVEGGSSWQQLEVGQLRWDDVGGLWLKRSVGEADLEAGRVGEALFVRYQRGQLRQKTARDMDLDAMADQLFGALGQASLAFGPLRYSPIPAEAYEGRAVSAYQLAAADAPEAPTAQLRAWLQRAARANAPPHPRWRQQLAERQVVGTLWVDQATGVILRAELRGQGRIIHPNAPPTQLQANLSHRMARIGHAGVVTAGAAAPEFRRRLRSRDPIGFYRQRQQAQAEGEAAP